MVFGPRGLAHAHTPIPVPIPGFVFRNRAPGLFKDVERPPHYDQQWLVFNETSHEMMVLKYRISHYPQ